MKTFASLLALLVTLVGLSSTASAAAPRFALAWVENTSDRAVTLYVSWGTGDWRQIVLNRGRSILLKESLVPGQAKVPALRVRMDVDSRSEREQLMEHQLTTGTSPVVSMAKSTKYAIRQFQNTSARQLVVTGVGHVKITNKDVPVPHVGPLKF
jgi:hypothetical protein